MKERNEKISRERFIRLGAALGMSIAGASALAACGEESSEGSANGAAKSNKFTKISGGKAPAGGQEIARTSRVPAGSAARFTNSGIPAVLVHLPNGKFAAYSAVCTHQGCTVTYQNGQLLCPCHGSVFDPSKRGEVLSGPAPLPFATDTDKGARWGDLSYLTNIFRLEEGEWKIVHRHADPITTPQPTESVIQE